MSKKTKEYSSTYERLIHEDPDFEKELNIKYKEFLLSELLLALMEEDHISVRKLAEAAGVSPSLVQDLRSGKKDNLTLKNFSSLTDVLGYDIVLEQREKKNKKEFPKRIKFSPNTRRSESENLKCAI